MDGFPYLTTILSQDHVILSYLKWLSNLLAQPRLREDKFYGFLTKAKQVVFIYL